MPKLKCERCGDETRRSGRTMHAPVCTLCGGLLAPVLDVDEILAVLGHSMGVEPRRCSRCGDPYVDRDETQDRCPACRAGAS